MASNGLKKNTIYNVIKTSSAILFPLITFPYISRVLLPENVGKINFSSSIVSYFTLIAGLGINTYAVRECAAIKDDKYKLDNIASQIFSINIITTFVSYLLLFFVLLFYPKFANYRTLILLQSTSILFTTLGADWLNAAIEDFKYITIRTVLFQLFSLILMFVFIHKPSDYYKYALITLLSSCGANILNMCYRKNICKLTFTLKIQWNKHFNSILYMFVMILAQTLLNNVDITMLGIIHGDYEVGIYSTATKISNIISQLGGAIMLVVIPRLSLLFNDKNYYEINKLLRKILLFLTTIGFPLAIGCIIVADDAILIIAGNGYEQAANVLRVLMISFLITQFSGFLGNAILLPSKQEKYYMFVCIVSAVFNIIMNYLFIPVYGAVGAAWTTTFSSAVVLLLLLLKVDKNVQLPNLRITLLPSIVGSLFIFLICIFFKDIDNILIRLIMQISCSALFYVIIQALFKNELILELGQMLEQKIKGVS